MSMAEQPKVLQTKGLADHHHDLVPFTVLDCVNFIHGDRYGYYRIILSTPSKIIKYFRFPCEFVRAVPDHKGWRLAFDKVPTGGWNCATLALDQRTQTFSITQLDVVAMQEIRPWHDVFVDTMSLGGIMSLGDAVPLGDIMLLGDALSGACEDDFWLQCEYKPHSYIIGTPSEIKENLKQRESTGLPLLQSDTAFVDCVWWPSDIYGVAHETLVHSWIHGHDIAPVFLAHVVENGSRVIGYITEHVSGRAAESSDLEACEAALRKLHALGIAYGDLSSDGFIVADDPQRGVLLHSFGAARKTDDRKVLQDEIDSLHLVMEEDAKTRRNE